MKNRSIRFKLILWFSLVLVLVTGATLFAVLSASGLVLRGTVRDYLISTVEENVDNIRFVRSTGDTAVNSYIPYLDGYLQIDLDFMDVVNDVHTALYTSDGNMLYGENPLPLQTSELPFTDSHTWRMDIDGERYDLYDRRLNLELPGENCLWIRGIVPETESTAQLGEIARLSLLLLPVLIMLAVISGYIAADRLLDPIRKIEETAEEISGGNDLTKRIEAVENNDEVGRLARVFNRMMDRIERSFEAERQFTSDASHELRTPTAVILMQSEYSLEKERTPEEYREALETVRKQGQRMNVLISDMLDYTRMDQGSARYELEKTDLSETVSEVSDQMAMIGTGGIELRKDIEEGVTVEGNRLLLSRLAQNLISNAYRYGRENGSIEVLLSSEGDRAVLTVADDGIGIEDGEKEKIFDRFYRSDASRSVQGTGLGLSMVKRIAELHGAEIEVESEPGKGSAFRVSFPLAR